MERFLWICFAGAIGTGTRYLFSLWAGARLGASFPYGTLVVNVVGCFLVAFAMQGTLSVVTFPPTLRLAITTGFLGGLTTYSTFNYETTRLFESGSPGAAIINFCATTVGGLLAGLLGLAIARKTFGA